jgi:phosphogluconate dehydratase
MARQQRAAACLPIGRLVDERCIVNAMVALLATGGSTNHLIHWVAVARSAGIVIDWDDFAACRMWCRCWPASTPMAAPT